MLIQRAAKLAAPRVVHARNKIQIVAIGRVGRRLQRRAAGQRNRRGRQTGARLGVIRRVALQIRLANLALIRRAHAVNHRGVGLQTHALR